MLNFLTIPGSLIVAFLCGIICLLLIEVTVIYYLFFRNTINHHSLSNTPSVDGYTFPQQLLELITEKFGENTSEGTVLLNLLLQFWFRENRYDVNTLSSIADRINSELTELLSNTSLGKIFSSLKIHDIELGSESPTISNVSLQNVDVNKELSTLNDFVFEFDISYVGGFYMAIDALMKFNANAAFVSVKVVKCVGRVRVEFTRIPYTYWCMSFVTPPELELTVESKLEGHSVPQLNRIIGIQLRRRINRKFVMPYYKIRSKPFLPTHNLTTNIKDNSNEIIQCGKLHVTIMTLSRIAQQEGTISCTIIMDTSPWIEDVQSTNNQMYILQIFRRPNKDVHNIENRKLSTGSIWYDKHQDGLRQRLKSMTGLDESCNVDDIVRRKSFADGGTISHKLGVDNFSQSESEELNIQQTKRLPYSELIAFNEDFKFFIGPSARYMNILVWNHVDDGQLLENLIGYISVPLINLISPGIGKKRRIFYLSPPSNSRNHAYQTLSTHPGFNHNLCYGDITLGIKFGSSSTLSPTLSSNEGTPVSLSPTKSTKQPPILLETTASLSDIDSELILSVHEFGKIITNKQTKCEFCQKKIWLKEASQCVKCHLICHKKCVAKCEKTSECRVPTSEGLALDDEGIEIASQAININPEIITTAPDNNGAPAISKNKISTFLANVKSIRRSGSASSLAPPGGGEICTNQAHSLPQTPNHSPSPSRKSSVFVGDVKLFNDEEEVDELEKALEYLLAVPKNEQFLESIKSSGKKLCMDLMPEKREARINEMITKIKAAIDIESENYKILQEKKKQAEDVHETAKLIILITKSEDRLQALTNLLLYCCSGLQDSQDPSRTPI